jgi:adenosylcobinamide-GDP ribazoletransferase
MKEMVREVTRLLAALQFLTVISVPWRREIQAAQLGKSAGFFPLVGAFIGGILVGLNYLFDLGLPPAVTRVLLLVILVVLTGGLHLDGLADTCDGLGGYRSVAERRRIMRDSRIGGYGVIGIVLLLLVKYIALIHIPDELMVSTLMLMPVASRWAVVYAIFTHPYARSSGLGKDIKKGTGWPQFTLATIIAVAAAALSLWPVGLAIWLIIGLVAFVLAAWFKKLFAGLTGDNYGAINEICEVGVLILIVLAVHIFDIPRGFL